MQYRDPSLAGRHSAARVCGRTGTARWPRGQGGNLQKQLGKEFLYFFPNIIALSSEPKELKSHLGPGQHGRRGSLGETGQESAKIPSSDLSADGRGDCLWSRRGRQVWRQPGGPGQDRGASLPQDPANDGSSALPDALQWLLPVHQQVQARKGQEVRSRYKCRWV